MRRQTDEIVDLLRQLTAQTDRWVDVRGQRHGVHRTHLHALAHLMEAERTGRAMSPGELADALRLSAPATTALVDRLVDAGHAERSRHPVDRRRTVLLVTDAARTTGSAIFAPLGQQLGAVAASLPPDEREVVARFLTAAVAAIDPDA
ncbi:MarR family winged helix-turn-helix transcriptional regulator [Aeromicrobium sp. CF4.19]|uniref:MarR family winged helix-turn-helix transcriptional regulator n=1 Tax=Aeromicrobium sp. CF4.19 TaxID=3373082 RepID=UPI003EE46762